MPYEVLRPLSTTEVDDGPPLLSIPLANSSGHARISPEDYQQVIAQGFSPNWYMKLGQVTTYSRSSGHARVARIILGIAKPGYRSTRVSHANGDNTDLRRTKLITKSVTEAKPRYGRDDRRPNARLGAGWRA